MRRSRSKPMCGRLIDAVLNSRTCRRRHLIAYYFNINDCSNAKCDKRAEVCLKLCGIQLSARQTPLESFGFR